MTSSGDARPAAQYACREMPEGLSLKRLIGNARRTAAPKEIQLSATMQEVRE
jgi:hypothetical protein